MLRIQRTSTRNLPCGSPLRGLALLALAVTVSGCSASLGRGDLSGMGFSDSTGTLAPVPPEPMRGAGLAPPREEQPRYRWRGGDRSRSEPARPAGPPAETSYAPGTVRMSGLPEPDYREPPRGAPPAMGRPVTAAPPPAPRHSARVEPTPVAAPSAGTIEVQRGDTLYGISKRYKVSISELMRINNLDKPMIKPGQRLALPATRGRRVAARTISSHPAPAVAPAPVSAPIHTAPSRPDDPIVPPLSGVTRPVAAPVAAPMATPVAAPAPAAGTDWTGSHTVSRGESLYGLSIRYKVKLAELQRANAITDARKVRPGTVLKVPSHARGEQAAEAAPPPRALERSTSPTVPVTIINSRPAGEPKRVAALGESADRATDAPPLALERSSSPVPSEATPTAPVRSTAISPPAAAPASVRFRWPAKGRVISPFGQRPDKSHNDGINIALPRGADVVAAETGVVTYAGNGLQGYGNLVLIRHDGGWVSAYAHNDQLLVKEGTTVRRGQAIAKAGNTGNVDQPQLHFELRQGSKPVDPMQHLASN